MHPVYIYIYIIYIYICLQETSPIACSRILSSRSRPPMSLQFHHLSNHQTEFWLCHSIWRHDVHQSRREGGEGNSGKGEGVAGSIIGRARQLAIFIFLPLLSFWKIWQRLPPTPPTPPQPRYPRSSSLAPFFPNLFATESLTVLFMYGGSLAILNLPHNLCDFH